MIYEKIEKIDLQEYSKDLTIDVRGNRLPVWWFIENFLWINDKDTGQMHLFKLNDAQKALYKSLCIQKREGRPMRQTILKARQLGMSTFIAGLFFCFGMYIPLSRWCVLADTKEHASNIFGMYETFYNYLNHSLKNEEEILEYPDYHKGMKHPDDLRPELEKDVSGKVMRTKGGRSTIEVVVAGESAGRSASYWGIHNSESAFQKDLQKTNAAITSSVSLINPNTMVFYETTANGFNTFKDKWDRDVMGYPTGLSAYEPTFFAWYLNPRYRLKVPNKELPKMEGWIYDKAKIHPEVDDEQLYWYWMTYTASMSKELMLQEFPWDPMDSFISTGHSIFDQEKLQKRKDEVVAIDPIMYGTFDHTQEYSIDGMNIKLLTHNFRESHDGQWKIYKEPIEGRPYVCICDPTKGFNTDYGCIQVIDNITGEQCAVYHSKTDDLDEMGFQLVCAGYYYNQALISSENNVGSAVLSIATKCVYPRIYFEQSMIYENANQNVSQMMGHCTTRGNRNEMIEDFRLAFNNNPNIINDYDTLCEMETFQRVLTSSGKIKIGACGSSFHDDMVMAYVPFWRVRIQQDMIASHPNIGLDQNDESLAKLNEIVCKRNREIKDKEKAKQQNTSFGIRW